jgi:hypothetical protein
MDLKNKSVSKGSLNWKDTLNDYRKFAMQLIDEISDEGLIEELKHWNKQVEEIADRPQKFSDEYYEIQCIEISQNYEDIFDDLAPQGYGFGNKSLTDINFGFWKIS